MQVISKGYYRPACIACFFTKKKGICGWRKLFWIGVYWKYERRRLYHFLNFPQALVHIDVCRAICFSWFDYSCADQHADWRKATWSRNCIQNKYSCDPIGWHEFTASYFHYLKEDHLTSKQNRECFTLDVFFKTRLAISTEIRDRKY